MNISLVEVRGGLFQPVQLRHTNVIAREWRTLVNPLPIQQNALLKDLSNIYSRVYFSQNCFCFVTPLFL